MFLTELLLSLLQESPEARIINVASSAHKQSARTDLADWQLERGYDPMRAYGNAKLFLILATQRLARLLKEKGIDHVTVNTMHPGAVASNFSVESDLSPVLKVLGKLVRRFLPFCGAGCGYDSLAGFCARSPGEKRLVLYRSQTG